ncbi:50S ribosomal protein L31 [Patescibacteria group bacterium]|nr:50S ribosomal protein L31 [Patescibacteria group bacterium]MBU2036384.1 50S ribosomal protein L31 [Patescibacteria group bacterium]
MKTSIHPKYYPKAKVTCACGNTFTTGATKEEIKVEICSSCHPFYTGQMKYVDTAGRVEAFRAKKKKAVKKVISKKEKRQIKKMKKIREDRERPESLTELRKVKKTKKETKKN